MYVEALHFKYLWREWDVLTKPTSVAETSSISDDAGLGLTGGIPAVATAFGVSFLLYFLQL